MTTSFSQKLIRFLIFTLMLTSLLQLFGCGSGKNPNAQTNPLQGKYGFSTHYQQPSKTDSKILEKGEIFSGSIELKQDGTFFISGTDKQQWPWQDKPQNRHEEEKGTYRIQQDILHFESPEVTDGGWSFSGDFKFFSFMTEEEALQKIGSKTVQYHLLSKPFESSKDKTPTTYLLLINPNFLEKQT